MTTEVLMESPLVTWVQLFHPEPLTPQELLDGVFLNEVLHQIDERACIDGVATPSEGDQKQLLTNWDILLRNIKSYYSDVLQQLIVMRLPDIFAIVRAGETEVGVAAVRRVLLLILGCAVQCAQKEAFIADIKRLDLGVQASIVDLIREVTDDATNVFPLDIPTEELDDTAAKLHTHLRSLVQERDVYVCAVRDLVLAVDDVTSTNQRLVQQSLVAAAASPSASPDGKNANIAAELADVKAKLRKCREASEEKSEQLRDSREDLDEAKTQLTKLRAENLELIQQARSARAYRDELDILSEKASRVDKYEAEITKYKEKLNELDFYKARVEELREDNEVLLETRATLEKQLEDGHKRIETVVELEQELLRYQQQLKQYSSERDADRARVQQLTEENARLEWEKTHSLNESANLEDQLTQARVTSSSRHTLGGELAETANAHILRLELENQKLSKQLQEMSEKTLIDNAARMLELEKENHRLHNKVEKLTQASCAEDERVVELEQAIEDLKHEKASLDDVLTTIRETTERQLSELEAENGELQTQVTTLRERNEKSHDLHVKETEKENKRLHEITKTLTAKLSSVEADYKQLTRAHAKIKDSAERIEHIEEENHSLVKAGEDMAKQLETLKRSCEEYDELEQKFLNMEVENNKLNKTVTSLQNKLQKLDDVEKENINLTVESKHLKRVVENMKHSTSQIADLEEEKDSLKREIQQMKKAMDMSTLDRSKHEQLEVDLLELDTENQKLHKTVDVLNRRISDLEQDNTELDSQCESLQQQVETLRLTVRRLGDVETENRGLEEENGRLAKEKSAHETEIKRLKSAVESRSSRLEELSAELSAAQRETRVAQRQLGRVDELTAKLKDLEKENMEIVQQGNVDKKTLNALREELVTEKIRAGDLQHEVERLDTEVKQVALSQEKAVSAALASDESALTSALGLEGRLQAALRARDEKVAALEERLGAARRSNTALQETLRTVRADCEFSNSVKAENGGSSNHHAGGGGGGNSPSSTKEILQLKDEMIVVERKNASLEEEVKHVKASAATLREQVTTLQADNSNLQSQLSSANSQYNMLQAQCANLQVETRTQQLQASSLTSQSALLRNQYTELEAEHEKLLTFQAEQQVKHEVLAEEHGQLVVLNEQLSAEYEALISETGSLKANHKQLKADYKELQDRYNYMTRERETLAHLKSTLEHDRANLRSDTHSYNNLQLDYVVLKEENMKLVHASDKVARDFHELNREHKTLKNEYNELKASSRQLNSDLVSARQQLSNATAENSRLLGKLESLTALNEKLEEDNRNLMMQLQALLTQNQELLTGCLDSKDQLAEEQKAYMERLADLRRQKEKLEEKIMEQFKRYDPVKKKHRGFFSNFLKKARSKSAGGSGGRKDKSMENLSHTSAEFGDSVNSTKNTSSASEWPDGPVRRGHFSSPSTTSFQPSSKFDDDDNDGGGLTLEEFLQEVDESPKSQQKFVADFYEQERHTPSRASGPETLALSPELGPRAPVIKSERKSPSPFKSKSEMNLSKLSTSLRSTSSLDVFSSKPQHTNSSHSSSSDVNNQHHQQQQQQQQHHHNNNNFTVLKSCTSERNLVTSTPNYEHRGFENSTGFSVKHENSAFSKPQPPLHRSHTYQGPEDLQRQQYGFSGGRDDSLNRSYHSSADYGSGDDGGGRQYGGGHRDDPHGDSHHGDADSTDSYSPGNVRSLVQNFQINIQQVGGPVAPPRRTRPLSAGPLKTSGHSSAFAAPQQSQRGPGGDQRMDPRSNNATTLPRSSTNHNDQQYTPSSQPRSKTPMSLMDHRYSNDKPSYPQRPMSQGRPAMPQHLSSAPERNTGRALPLRPDERPAPQHQGQPGVRRPGTEPGGQPQPRPGSRGPPSGPPQPQGDNTQQQPPPGGKKNPIWYEYGCV